jgi:phosphate transport system permease protein
MNTDADTPHFFHTASHGSLRRAFVNRLLNLICVVLALLTFVPLVSILLLLLQKGLPLLDWKVFTELPPTAGAAGGGFGNAVVGTLIMVGLSIGLATPFGVLSAIYVNEYRPNAKLSHAVRFVAKLLTGIPSIISGVFAYAVFVLAKDQYGQPLGFSAMAGGFALAILILPTIMLTAEQALLGVSRAYREASYGLGAASSCPTPCPPS